MDFSVRIPGKRTSDARVPDARVTVTLTEPGTPWPIRLHFLHLGDPDTGERSYRHVGFEIGAERVVPPGPGNFPLDPKYQPLDPVTVQRIATNYASYLEIARHAIVLEQDGVAAAARRLRGPGRKPARLTEDFFRMIAADVEARQRAGERYPTKAIAEAYHVDISTASRWIKRARQYMSDEDEPGAV